MKQKILIVAILSSFGCKGREDQGGSGLREESHAAREVADDTPRAGVDDLEIYVQRRANGSTQINVREKVAGLLADLDCGGLNAETCVFEIQPDKTIILKNQRYRRWGSKKSGEVVTLGATTKAIQTSLGSGKPICRLAVDLSHGQENNVWLPPDGRIQCYSVFEEGPASGYSERAGRIKFDIRRDEVGF